MGSNAYTVPLIACTSLPPASAAVTAALHAGLVEPPVLLNAGVLDRNADGTIEFPYDAVHVDFMITAASVVLNTTWCIL
ncbi:hypothetical protein QFZ94_000772 [Paraburkholderia sp. JPY465]|uniref:hypothetical protein n=1 Tax=Paraburkholderia sp. JPY465 TaxID=3042285 RepID=UPI003D237EFC